MNSHNTLTLNSDDFEREVEQSSEPVLVDFWAEWCPPCKVMGPTIDELAGEFDGRATIAKVDVDSNTELAQRFNIQSIPTMILFVDGQEIERHVGIVPKAKLVDAIDRYAGATS